ncbi:unnamed protein product [Phytomonas sp. EM1]|nr:unnamed protein product [Phytomonas sp. EM1]|eukprot:CCW60311.1 unnamed protein product [Phytomonas sp. isolate EM1]
MSALREVSNLTNQASIDVKQRQANRLISTSILNLGTYRSLQRSGAPLRVCPSRTHLHASDSNSTAEPTQSVASPPSLVHFSADARHAREPIYCTELIDDITEMFLDRERQAVRRFNEGTTAQVSNASQLYAYYASPHCLQYQPEVNEKMRMILIDWLIDVHLKFKLHPETMFLAVNLIDRYLSCINTKYNALSYVPRSQLQLVGVCAMLLAAKYEEIWPPELKECVHISANTYTREEIIKMERNICAALSFRLTVPTPYPFASRLLTLLKEEDFLGLNSDEETRQQQFNLLRHTTGFFLEHALLDYKCLQFTPSQIGNAAVFLALVTLHMKYSADVKSSSGGGRRLWSLALQDYTKSELSDFSGCAEVILDFVSYVPTTKYQAVRRKYNSTRHGEVSKLMMPNQLPTQ